MDGEEIDSFMPTNKEADGMQRAAKIGEAEQDNTIE